jgi:hypothetical protein
MSCDTFWELSLKESCCRSFVLFILFSIPTHVMYMWWLEF